MNLSTLISKERGVYLVHFKGDEIYTPLMDKIKQIHPGLNPNIEKFKIVVSSESLRHYKKEGDTAPKKGVTFLNAKNEPRSL